MQKKYFNFFCKNAFLQNWQNVYTLFCHKNNIFNNFNRFSIRYYFINFNIQVIFKSAFSKVHTPIFTCTINRDLRPSGYDAGLKSHVAGSTPSA